MGIQLTIDLTAETQQARDIVSGVVNEQVGPWIADQLQARWPRRTGRSADAWTWDAGSQQVTNAVDYTEFVTIRGGLAIDTVLTSIESEASSRDWQE